jgi:predicted O-linked N-acetylglucosamine transferase (SPINDLY family)
MRILITGACGVTSTAAVRSLRLSKRFSEAFRCGLRDQMDRSPLVDEPRFVRGIEALYLQMWARRCEGFEHV